MPLNDAYHTAHDRKAAAEDLARRAEGLKRHYADLEDRVKAEELSLDDAFSIAAERQREEDAQARLREEHAQRISTRLATAIQFIVETVPYPQGGEPIVSLFDQRKAAVNYDVTGAALEAAIKSLQDLREGWL